MKTKAILKSSLKSKVTNSQEYLMKSEEEAIRLDIKTDPVAVQKQALWCGVKPGMRVLDGGCGSGKTTMLINEIVRPGGMVVGVDYSKTHIEFAEKKYGSEDGIAFYLQDIRESMDWLGQFDLVWVRFVLEYYRDGAFDIVKNLWKIIKPGGSLCLLDLDYNSLIHYKLPEQIEYIMPKIMNLLDDKYNFDTFAGRKLYSFLYDSGFENIDVELMAHNLIFGEIKDKDIFNLTKKVEIAIKKAEKLINSYPGGYKQFSNDLREFLVDPRRFSYTPLLLCKGVRPLVG
jgi:ubiquinone/menaquinone biosynthesis C-methylase UbiE